MTHFSGRSTQACQTPCLSPDVCIFVPGDLS